MTMVVKKRQPAAKRSTAASQTGQQVTKGQSRTMKFSTFVKTKKGGAIVGGAIAGIVIIVAILIATVPLTIGDLEVEQEPTPGFATMMIVNPANGVNVTGDFKATVYTQPQNTLLTNRSEFIEFGVFDNIGAMKLSFGQMFNGINISRYWIRLNATSSSYGNMTESWVFVNEQRQYLVQISRQPLTTTYGFSYFNGTKCILPNGTKANSYSVNFTASDVDDSAWVRTTIFDGDLMSQRAIRLNVTFNGTTSLASWPMSITAIDRFNTPIGFPCSNCLIGFSWGANNLSFVMEFSYLNGYNKLSFTIPDDIAITSSVFSYGPTILG